MAAAILAPTEAPTKNSLSRADRFTRCNSSPPQMKSAHPSMRIVF